MGGEGQDARDIELQNEVAGAGRQEAAGGRQESICTADGTGACVERAEFFRIERRALRKPTL